MNERSRTQKPVLVAALVALVALAAPACSGSSANGDHAATTFAPAAPGTLTRAEPFAPPPNANAWKITYHSRAVDGRDILVTGMLVTPASPAPAGGFPLITWGHPTTGTADSCAPSAKGTDSLPVLTDLVSRGWAIVATDYEGLGTPDGHPYLVGVSEGRAVLDAARAAVKVTDAGVQARSPVVIWGFSQGGHGAAFAGQIQPTYAPELDVRGVAIASPVSDVAHFAKRAEQRDDQFGVLVTIAYGYAQAYHDVDPTTVLNQNVIDRLGDLEKKCIGDVNEEFTAPVATMLRRPATEEPAFARHFAENQAGQDAIGVPVLVVQGAKDDIVDPHDTEALVHRYCQAGTTVRYVVEPDAKHGVIAADPFVPWIAARFAGESAASTC